MKDSEIPAFTSELLAVCTQAVKDGIWMMPMSKAGFNHHCCPLMLNKSNGAIEWDEELDELGGFTRGYDNRPIDGADYRFYILGQAFRKIALTIGFK